MFPGRSMARPLCRFPPTGFPRASSQREAVIQSSGNPFARQNCKNLPRKNKIESVVGCRRSQGSVFRFKQGVNDIPSPWRRSQIFGPFSILPFAHPAFRHDPEASVAARPDSLDVAITRGFIKMHGAQVIIFQHPHLVVPWIQKPPLGFLTRASRAGLLPGGGGMTNQSFTRANSPSPFKSQTPPAVSAPIP